MNKRSLLITLALIVGMIAPLLAADARKVVLNDDQEYRVRYAVLLINEADYMHAAFVIEPLIEEIDDPTTVQDLRFAYDCLFDGSYEMVVRARYILVDILGEAKRSDRR